ncbi:MAG: type IV pilus secretin PilQ [Thermoanaerobaculia bacterium]
MLRNGRAIVPVLATLAMSLVVSCASQTESGTANNSAPRGASEARGSVSEPVVLTGATLLTDGEAPRLLLSGNGPLSTTIFPRGDGAQVIVDLPNTVASPGLEPPRGSGSLLTQVAMKSFVELGKPHVQFEMTSRSPLDAEMGTVPGSSATAVTFTRRQRKAAETELAAAPAAVAEPPSSALSEPSPIRVETLQTASIDASPATRDASSISEPRPEPVSTAGNSGPIGFVSHAVQGRPATQLSGLSSKKSNGVVVIRLEGDGSFGYEAFSLANPPRYVVDLASVRNSAKKRQVDLAAGPVSRVRFSQFKTDPQPVTRVVFDLAEGEVPTLTSTPGGLSLAFRTSHASSSTTMAARAPSSATPVKDEPSATARPSRDSESASSSTLATANRTPASGSYEKHESEDAHEAVVRENASSNRVSSSTASVTVAETRPVAPAVETAPAAPIEPTVSAPPQSASVTATASAINRPVERAVSVERAPMAVASPQIVATSTTTEVRLPAPSNTLPAPRAAKKRKGPNAEDRALVEAAEALLVQQDAGSSKAKDLINPYESKTIGGGDKPYTGEPITLNLKDADIKDTLQKFSELTGLNIVLDPDVRGTVTVSLTDIPWDQALELILKINNLGYVLEGSVMRISSTSKLSQEETNRVALIKAQEANRPVKTVIQKLSYSKADDTAITARKIMSVRGDIFIDERSNTLIIKELPDYLPTVLDLIRNLDVPTPQVMIEARVVEATRAFLKQLGVDWGVNARADASHGNTTGLVFPNSADLGGAVSLPSGNQLLKLSLANVLDTVRLDFALSAAESRGLLKIVSTPKVQTQTNQLASIQSGFQIPVQTTVNNTTSVLYIDATLRLDVTPQITAEGTIIMDVKVQKREPAVALNIAIGNNIPLITRDAKTRLMVRDGGTAVIGGIFKFTTNDQRSMVPGLWKIPLLGNLFRNRTEREDTDELMIFITPRIMKY